MRILCQNPAHEGRLREGTPECGAGAVPVAALRAAAGGFCISPSGPMPDCEVLAALVPERVLPFASGGSRKRWLKPSRGEPREPRWGAERRARPLQGVPVALVLFRKW